MSNHVLVVHAPEDREVAAYLAGDLERQGVRATASAGDQQALYAASAVAVLIGPMSATAPMLRGEAERAAAAGKPIHAVRVAEVGGEVLAGLPIASWTDAFGPQAQANVARLGQDLRMLAGAAGGAAAAPPYAPGPYPGAHGHAPGARSGRPTGLIIAGSVFGGILLVIGLLEATEVINLHSTRSSYASSSSTSSTVPSAFDTNSSVNSFSPAPAPVPASVTEAWLAGGSWQPRCGHPNFMTFRTDGVTENQGGTGTYTLAGEQVTLAGADDTISFTVKRVATDTLSIALPGRSAVQLRRCYPERSYVPGLGD